MYCSVGSPTRCTGAGADPSSASRIAEWPPRAGGLAWHPNGNHLSAKSGWDETGTGESQHSPARRSVGPALTECCAAPTACSLGPSGADTSGGADSIRSGRRLEGQKIAELALNQLIAYAFP